MGPGKHASTDVDLGERLELIQGFMVKKGLIDINMSNDELKKFLEQSEVSSGDLEPATGTQRVSKSSKSKEGNDSRTKGNASMASGSEMTIYKRAVQQLDPNMDKQIEELLNKSRQEANFGGRKISSSSEEMDTSDETIPLFIGSVKHKDGLIAGDAEGQVSVKQREKTPQEQADQVIKEAENSRARMFEVPGEFNSDLVKNSSVNINLIDQDYQMIDSHVDETLHKKIINLEYVEFSKLIPHNKTYKDDETGQWLEIINKNGQSFLSPISERERVSITSYAKWEQAFRVFSNILTSRYPEKAPELLQYNHTIHSASTTFIWDNVYSYDREFRRHIARHPYRSFAVILQQAWTMILKDRVRNENSYFQKGAPRSNKRDKEPCCRFNRGRCSFGLSCKYDHRCSVHKCGKFGHGTHICQLRDNVSKTESSTTANGPAKDNKK